MKRIKIFVIIFFIVIINYGQTMRIVQLFDSNLFLLDNGDTVKMAGIDIPILNHSNQELREIADEVIKYIESNLIDKPLEFEYVRDYISNEKYKLVHIKRNYPLETIDYNQTFLEEGYGKYNKKVNAQYLTKYENTEYNAYINYEGIWSIKDIEKINLYDEKKESNIIYSGKEIKEIYVKTITGDEFIGTYESSDEQTITYKTKFGLKTFYKNEILEIVNYKEKPQINVPVILKDPGTASLLSLLLPGAGQIYCENLWGGILLLGATAVSYSFAIFSEDTGLKAGAFLVGAGFHIYSFIDALYRARKYNEDFNYGLIFDKENIYFSMNFNF